MDTELHLITVTSAELARTQRQAIIDLCNRAFRKDDHILPTQDDEDVMILRLPRTPELDLSAPLSVEWREGEVW